MTTRVILADDDALVRTGLRVILERRGLTVQAEAADGIQAVRLASHHAPDVVLMDIRMPRLDGIEATRAILEERPSTRVLILTTYDHDEYVYEALRAGAAGFLLKTTPPDRLVEGIETVAAGEALLAPSITRRLIEAHVRRPAPTHGVPPALAELTGRERDVLVQVAHGRSNREIAEILFISQATVKTHINRIFQKLGLAGRAQAVTLAYETGLVEPGGTDDHRG
jgi:DNA-binding NarL/FixJ family response regulator